MTLLAAACTAPPTRTGSPSPTATPDIGRVNLDIVYSAFVDQDVHRVTSRRALTAALEALVSEVRFTGGDDALEMPEFTDEAAFVRSDFEAFAAAVTDLVQRNDYLTPERTKIVAITGMLRESPDCHTYYLTPSGRIDSRPVSVRGTGQPTVPDGEVIKHPPDEAGLLARMLPGGIAYIRFTEFRITGTYDIREEVRNVLDAAVAMGARAWLFDIRGNVGGNGAEIIASYFLDGEPGFEVILRNGSGGVSRANPVFRLPEEYQLPIAIVQNDRGGSGPEVFALFLKENDRATIVGGKSIGCLGATSPTGLADGTAIFIVTQEFVGAVTGTNYNNVGIPPDIEADDATAVQVAVRHLQEQITGN